LKRLVENLKNQNQKFTETTRRVMTQLSNVEARFDSSGVESF